MPEFGKFIDKLINREAGARPASAETLASKRERQGVVASEKRAEELYAFWRDFGRLKMQAGKLERERKREKQETPTAEETRLHERLEKLRQAIAVRWHDKETRAAFQQNLVRSFQEKEKIASNYKNFKQLEKERGKASKNRDGLYQEIFSRRGTEADELTQIELAETAAQIKLSEAQMEQMEKVSPELAAHLSFERLQTYHRQLAKGFIWTPSREEYFNEILEHLVILDQNRPVLLSGETGTGKTRLARAVGERLTGQAPYEVGEEAKTDIRPLLGSQSIDKDGSYVVYGQLGQAMTGKENTRQEKAGSGGLFYMDEMNGYPPDALRALIKQISGRRPGEEISFAAWRGKKEKITAEFGFLGSANLPSEKHPDRNPLPVEVARELSAIDVDYPPQTKNNPELYEMMLAALMDQNGRLRVPKEELAPQWNPIVVDGKTRRYELDVDPEAGGTLWRFANFVAETQKSYKGQENIFTDEKSDASYLRQAVLDPGLVLSWLAEYRKSALRQGLDLQNFLAVKIDSWREQKIYPEEDQQLIEAFQCKFNLVWEDKSPENDFRYAVLSSQEIGALSPRVPRQAETILKPPEPEWLVVYTANGSAIEYKSLSWQNFEPGDRLTPKGKKTPILTFLGLSKDNMLMLESADGALVVDQNDFKKKYEKEKTPEFIITVKNALNPYREALLEGGIPPAQAPEKQDTKIDLIQLLKQDQSSYQGAGLTEWAQSLNGLENCLSALSLEKKKIIEQEIQDGAIPIFMPGKDVQFALTVERLTKQLKPLWIKDGQPQTVADTYLDWNHFINLIQTKAAELLADVPTRPYILFTKPTKAPEARTCSKTVDQQNAELTKIIQERGRQKRATAYSMNPHEYVATQKCFTERLPIQASGQLQTINPLDQGTYTRFIHLPLAGGDVPDGSWYPGDRQLKLGGSDAGDPDSSGGFRLSVRVEI